MSTYPYLPGLPDDEDENSDSALSRKRLASFARYKRPQSAQGQKEKEGSGGGLNAASGGPPNSVSGGPPNLVSGGLPGFGRKDGMEFQKSGIPRPGTNIVQPGGKTATRSDVKETLKSMGLRCEDFTISVYSREQAHAILRRQGVEVTPNNLPSREKYVGMGARGGYKNADMRRTAQNMQRAAHMRNVMPPNIRKAPPRYEEEDDDDCVILDPPDMPKPPPVSLPQQFQLMGTTVQVNRGAKRPNRPMMNQPLAKRPNARPMQYYQKEHEEYGAEASVQDTLKRLKNYNISITCRRNASGYGPRGPMDSESEIDDESHMESDEEEEDMTKYLECQIGEIDDIPEQEMFDEDDVEYEDKDDMDYNPRGKRKRSKSKTPRKGRRSVDPMLDPASMLEQEMPDSEMETPSLETSKEMEDSDNLPASEDGENKNDESGTLEEAKDSNNEDNENEEKLENEECPDEEKKAADDDLDTTTANEGKMEDKNEKESDTEETKNENSGEEALEESETGQNDEEEKEPEEEKEAAKEETENVEDIINKEMETENEGEGKQDGPDDEEIDDELEKELLAGDVGEDGEMEEDL